MEYVKYVFPFCSVKVRVFHVYIPVSKRAIPPAKGELAKMRRVLIYSVLATAVSRSAKDISFAAEDISLFASTVQSAALLTGDA